MQLKYFAIWNKVAGYNRDAVLSKVIIAFFSLFLFVWYFYSSSKIDGFFITDKWNLNYPLLIIKMTLLPRNLSESRTATTSLHNLQNSYRILIKLNNYLNQHVNCLPGHQLKGYNWNDVVLYYTKLGEMNCDVQNAQRESKGKNPKIVHRACSIQDKKLFWS